MCLSLCVYEIESFSTKTATYMKWHQQPKAAVEEGSVRKQSDNDKCQKEVWNCLLHGFSLGENFTFYWTIDVVAAPFNQYEWRQLQRIKEELEHRHLDMRYKGNCVTRKDNKQCKCWITISAQRAEEKRWHFGASFNALSTLFFASQLPCRCEHIDNWILSFRAALKLTDTHCSHWRMRARNKVLWEKNSLHFHWWQYLTRCREKERRFRSHQQNNYCLNQ